MTRSTCSRLTLSRATLNHSTKRDDNNKRTARRSSNNGDCTCDELIVAGKRQPPPPGHDCEYVRKRKALIPLSMKVANEMVEIVRDDGVSSAKWTRCFSTAVDELARPLLNGPHGA
jgi:hypothetical protein